MSKITNVWSEVVCPNCSVAALGGYHRKDAIKAAKKAKWIEDEGELFCSAECLENWIDPPCPIE